MSDVEPLQVAIIHADGSCTMTDLPTLRGGDIGPDIEFVRKLTEEELERRMHTAELPFQESPALVDALVQSELRALDEHTFELSNRFEDFNMPDHYSGPPRNRAERRKSRYKRKGKGKYHET